MAHFLDLPPELLPIILGFISSPQHIFTLCLVNKSFNSFATPFLYHRVFIFAWYKDVKTKVVVLFRTLSGCPHLARHVKKLVIKDFPKALSLGCNSESLQNYIQGIRNCVNLRSCTWTRDGSLQSPLLESLRDCPRLHELEINGNGNRYNPILLTQFSHLSKISLMMPNAHVLDIFPAWISITGETLRSLTIHCLASTVVTDIFLSHLASNLQGLEYLSIIGCPKVTHRGIEAIISANKDGLIGLTMEGLSQTFDMSVFRTVCLRTNAFRRLRAITLNTDMHSPVAGWMHDVGDLLSSAPLEAFAFSTCTSTSTATADKFWNSIVTKHSQRLRSFSVHRMQISLASLEMVCSQCPLLENLFLSVYREDVDDAVYHFGLARNLRTIHINFRIYVTSEVFTPASVLMQRATSIASVCSSTLVHIGCNERTWQVERMVHVDEKGEKYIIPRLAPHENPDIPEQFLVVRA